MMRTLLCSMLMAMNAFAATKITPPGSAAPAKITITRAANGPAYPGAGIRIVSPKPDELLNDDSVGVIVDLVGFNLGVSTPGEMNMDLAYSKMDSSKPDMPYGQHVHVIVDNEPYMACYTPRKPFWIPKRLAPGMHTLRVFPSRSWHESVKQKNCFAAETFYVKQKSGTPVDLTKPYLTYSRPKGEYSGKGAGQVMVDFYVANCELGKGRYTAKIVVDAHTTMVADKWCPYIIKGLTAGSHTVSVALIDPKGQPVEGAWNSTQRTITIK